jgi:hypothetical protein
MIRIKLEIWPMPERDNCTAGQRCSRLETKISKMLCFVLCPGNRSRAINEISTESDVCLPVLLYLEFGTLFSQHFETYFVL